MLGALNHEVLWNAKATLILVAWHHMSIIVVALQRMSIMKKIIIALKLKERELAANHALLSSS